MDDNKLIQIVKENFREEFELVEHSRNTSPVTVRNPNSRSYNIYDDDSNHSVIGIRSTSMLTLSLNKFKFCVVWEGEKTFTFPKSVQEYKESRYNYQTDVADEKIYYYIDVMRMPSENSNSYKSQLLTKRIDITEKDYTEIENSTLYDEVRMDEELNTLLEDVRNKKIDKLTSEE